MGNLIKLAVVGVVLFGIVFAVSLFKAGQTKKAFMVDLEYVAGLNQDEDGLRKNIEEIALKHEVELVPGSMLVNVMRANVGLGNFAPAYRRDAKISLKYTVKVTPVYRKEESISLDKTTLP